MKDESEILEPTHSTAPEDVGERRLTIIRYSFALIAPQPPVRHL